ncbi:MAG: carboxypeptidase regulatory-like domain-containing protein [Ardenticatenia bacterium]|nr:MAG: carboxypeptidase regulatory-like domain-containing protein [Ardenticatenia bacterium]
MNTHTKRIGLSLVLLLLVAFPSVGYAASPLQQRATPTPTPTATATPIPPTATATPSPEPTTSAPSLTPTATFTSTPVPPTATPPAPNTPTATQTPLPQPTEVRAPTATATRTNAGTGTDTQSCCSRVEGFVVDAQGAGWPGVLVRLRGGGWQAEWLTDSNGFFYFNNLGAGQSIIEALVEGQVLAQDVIETTGTPGEVISLRLVLGQTGMATATPTPTPEPTKTPQVQTVLPQTGNDVGVFSQLWLLVATLFALSLMGVIALRRRFDT